MDAKLITSAIELGISGLAVGVMAYLLWYVLTDHRKERNEYREERKEMRDEFIKTNSEQNRVLERLTDIVGRHNRD